MNVEEEENEVMLPQRHLLLLNNLLLCFLPHLVKLLSHSCHGKCLPVTNGKDLISDILRVVIECCFVALLFYSNSQGCLPYLENV